MVRDEVRTAVRAAIEAARAHAQAAPVRLPARRYVDRSFYDAERAEIFGRAWLLAGRLDEVPTPGLYMTWEKTRIPLLIVHAVDGVIRCFYNSCRHRGAPVVRVARGRNRALRCQYHSWTYDTTGKLVSVPDERDFVDLRREERALVPVNCTLSAGGIFVNEDADAPPLDTWFGAAGEESGAVDGGGLRTLAQRAVTIPVNWKRVMERFLNAPPVPPRPGLPAPAVEAGATSVEAFAGGHLRIVAPFDEPSAGALGLANPLAWTDLQDEGLTDIPSLDPMFRSTATTYALFPNVLLTFTPSGVFSFALWPSDEETTLLEATWYAPDWGEADSPEALPGWQARIAWAQSQLDETGGALDRAQAEMQEPARQGLALQNVSEAVRLWHEALDARIHAVVPADTLVGAVPGEVRSPVRG